MNSPRAMANRALPILLCGAVLFVIPAEAQTAAPPPPPSGQAGPPQAYGGPRRGGPDRRAEMLQKQLDLTPEQTTQVKALMEAEHTKMEALHSNTSLSPEEMRTQSMAIHGESDTELRALLTPDQVTKLDAMQARMRERRQNGNAPPPPPPAPQR